MTGDPVRILIVDRQPLFSSAMKAFISAQKDLAVVGQAPTAAEATTIAGSSDVDVVILDRDVPGIVVPASYVAVLRSFRPGLRVILIGDEEEDQGAAMSIEIGADAYLSRQATADQVLDRLRHVTSNSNGSEAADTDVQRRLEERRLLRETIPTIVSTLPVLERRIATLLGEGATLDDVGAALQLSQRDVRAHVRNLLANLGVASLAQLRDILRSDGETVRS